MSENEAERGSDAQAGLRGVLPPGTLLRGYEIKSVLGHGAFGITYRALDTTLHRDVAIKEYLPTTLALRDGRTTVLPRSADHMEQFAWGRDRFLDEARVLARLDRTSAIIRVFDFLEANGTAYMVMALVEGETLHKRLQREQRLTPDAVQRILFPLLDGLEEVHAATFLHRDIKPANIMLDGKGQPTLIDFGASRAAMAERSTTMTAIFTPGYAAAEQFIASGKLGPWTDIYGLSATLYHAITGRIPPSAVERILEDTYEPLSKLRPDGYAPALLEGIDAGMAVRAPERPQSLAEWRDMLRPEAAAVDGVTQVTPARRRLARAARQTSRAGLTIRGPALWGAAAAIVLALAGGGWLAYVASGPATVTTAALNLSAEQLEQALGERRKADALAAEKKQLEQEAQRKAEAEAEAKRQADQELVQARQARQKAEDELAQLKADIEARRKVETGQQDQAEAAIRRATEEVAQRKAEAETASLRQAEDEAQKKATAEAEAKRLADEALAKAEAARQQADKEARLKSEAEAAKLKADDELRLKAEAAAAQEKGNAEAQKKAAEAAENALRLATSDRQRLQVALTSLGFDTRGTDGVLGPRSREMIAGWQQKGGVPATGFVTAAQRDQMFKSAAAAVALWDEEQKKIDDEKKRADDARTAATAAPAPSVTARPAGPFHGTYRGSILVGGGTNAITVTVVITNGRGVGTLTKAGCDRQSFTFTVSSDGALSGSGNLNCPMVGAAFGISPGAVSISGKATDRELQIQFYSNLGTLTWRLTRSADGATALATPSTASPDGLWRGTYTCDGLPGPAGMGATNFTMDLALRIKDGSSSGGGFSSSYANGGTVEISVSINSTNVTVTRAYLAGASVMRTTLSGQFDGNSIRANGMEPHTRRLCALALTRA